MRTLQHPLTGLLCCALVVSAGACKEEGPTTLFDEAGTWSLYASDLRGMGIMPIDAQERVDQFLLNFDPETQIVSAASCIDSMGQTSIEAAFCDTHKFVCRCFSYTFTESQMVWQEFAGEGENYMAAPMPPEDSGVDLEKATVIKLEQYPMSNGTYRFSTLPYGLFDSDAQISKYVFQIRGNNLFVPTGCVETCGATPLTAPEG